METGFLNPIHDEEHFSSSLYTQGNGLDANEHILFGEMIVPEIVDYDDLWHSNDDIGIPVEGGKDNKEEFQKMLYEWQNQLDYMQEPEAIKQIVSLQSTATQEVSEILSSSDPTSNVTTRCVDPSIDELFPLETGSKNMSAGEIANSREEKFVIEEILNIKQEESREEEEFVIEEILNIKQEESREQEEFVIEEFLNIKREMVGNDKSNSGLSLLKTNTGVKTAASISKSDHNQISSKPTNSGVETMTSVSKLDRNQTITSVSKLDRNQISSMSETDSGMKTVISNSKLDCKQEINVKVEEEPEKEVDVETVGEEVPLLLAGDLTSLLEQFEATEKVNVQPTPQTSPPRPSSQTIRDALPVEVIKRIKASRENHKKVISVIPAMPNKRLGKAATRMQDAGATLSRNKLLKLVTGGSGGESVQLDHDYCTNGDSTSSSSRSYCMSDSSEYPSQSSTPDTSFSRQPDFKPRDSGRACDTGSRKDSGLESGENSDEEVPLVNETRNKLLYKSKVGHKSVHIVNEKGVVIGGGSFHKNVPMVSVLKKNNMPEKDSTNSNYKECLSPVVQNVASPQCDMDTQEVVKKKKKLNLEEYRVRREERERIRSQESSRANSPVPCSSPPVQPDSTTSQEGISKEKPLMHSVEVQTQTCDFIDLTSKSSKDLEKSRMDKDKRNDLKYRSYQSRHPRSSSSSSSADVDRSRSRRRKASTRRRSRSRRKSSVSRMWSRSPSPSSGSCSDSSSHSRSRSRSRDRRQKWRSRSPRRNYRHDSPRNCRNERDRSWQRGHSPMRGTSRGQDFPNHEKVKQIEERRVVYVGHIDEGTTKADLRRRFQQFGPIVDISVHFRERGDNYGFVTFAYKADAYKAVEHGNDNPKLPRYDLCFGGRRAFCKQRYADLDGMATSMQSHYGPPMSQPRTNDSFDLLLNEVKAKMRKRSSV